MKLSIITINYNNVAGLQKTIQSILSQTWKDFEWIVIDGGSTDGSVELLDQYKNHFSYWCHEKDRGVFNAMNKGIVHAQGDYLNFMNSGDEYYEPETLAKVFKMVTDDSIGVYYGDYYESFSDGHLRERIMPKELDLRFIMHMPINHQSTFIRRGLLTSNEYDETYRIVSDWKAFIQWLVAGVPFMHLDLHIAKFDMSGINQTMEEKKNLELQRMFQESIPPAIRIVINNYEEYLSYSTLQRTLHLFKNNRIYFSIIARVVKVLYRIDSHFHKHPPLI